MLIKAKQKGGFTLIELMVSMAIFSIVISLAIASFMNIMKMEALGTNMSNSQQKVRVALEQISRLARQADKVEIANDLPGTTTKGRTVKFYFLTQGPPSAIEFIFYNNDQSWVSPNGTLYVYNCATMSNGVCSDPNWSSTAAPGTYAQDLFGGINNGNILKLEGVNTNYFSILPQLPPTLGINLSGAIPSNSTKIYYNDSMTINTEVIMDNIK